MALQTSGAISLNQIHVEAGGSSGTTATINDSDIRGLINKASGATMSFSEWYGASGNLEQTTVTAGSATIFYATWTGFQNFTSPNIGSLSDTTFSPKSASYAGIYHVGSGTINFRLHGTHTNAGWTSITIGTSSLPYTRSSATFVQSGGDTLWYWSAATTPFTSGSNTTVTFL